jgi:MoxR-like ATPase
MSGTTIGVVKPNELKEVLVRWFREDPLEMPALFIWGPPGVGKSSIVKQAALEVFGKYIEKAGSEDFAIKHIKLSRVNIEGFERIYKEERGTYCDPTDLKGIPRISGDATEWLPPASLPREDRDAPQGVLFLDELPSAPPAVQIAMHRLVLDRELENYKLPDGWHVVAAGNRRTDMSVVYEMPSPLANRFVHLEVEPDLDAWKEWAYKARIRHEVIAFLNMMHSTKKPLLLDMEAAKNSVAFPSPRSWEMVSRILDVFGPNEKLIAGAVGTGAAVEFIGFLKVYKDLPSPEDALKNGIVPKEPSQVYALCGAIASLYSRNPKKFAKTVLEYSYKLPKDFAVLLVRDCIKANKHIAQVPEWIEWARTFSNIVL